MRIECPNCQAAIEVVDDSRDLETSCPTCGSRVPSQEKTVTYRPVPNEQIGHFELLEKVGMGQFGSVWRAKDMRLGRIVAVKIPRRDEFGDHERNLFLREAHAAAMLEHSNIVRIHEVSDEHERVYIASEFIYGETLKNRLESEGYTHRKSAELMATIAEAVHFANEKGIVHRDLKPANILLDADGEPHVTDFGIAKLTAGDFTLTAAGAIIGTPAYMSPEQARGENHLVDRRSDVFSLGVVLYQMLTGKKPFSSSSQVQLLQQIQIRDPRGLRAIDAKIPRDMETICLKAMAKTPDRRYATAKEFADDLRRYLDGAAIFARSESSIERGIRWIRRNRALAGVGLLAILSTAMAFQFGLQGREKSPSYPPGTSIDIISPINVEIETEPPGASVVYIPRDKFTGEPIADRAVRPSGKTPVTVELLPGEYYVVAKLDDGRFHEVQRYIPKTANEFIKDPFLHRTFNAKPKDNSDIDSIAVAPIKIPMTQVTDGMTLFEGSPLFQVGAGIDKHPRRIDPFLLETHEVTIQDYLAKNDGRFPRNLRPQGDPWPDAFPLTHLLLDSAIEYAESIGKRLPSEFEYEFAATNGGTTHFPWGDEFHDVSFEMSPVMVQTFDKTTSTPPVFGLYSNALEFTDSWLAPYPMLSKAAESMMPSPGSHVVVRGGTLASTGDIKQGDPRSRLGLARSSTVNERIGFRCARSKNLRW